MGIEGYVGEILIIFGCIFFGIYFIPAGIFHLYFRKLRKSKVERIQPKIPSKKDMRREFKLSFISVIIFTACTFMAYQLVKNGYTRFYFDWFDYPIWYAVLSFFLCLIIHDTYFYWSHRFMHLPGIFKYFHLGHHRSLTPSPWASLAFQPLEAIVQFGTFLLIVIIIPLHPAVFLIYIVYDSLVNTAGHNGVELVPNFIAKNPILKFGNTVTHHDLHHIDFTKNYGAFFNIWDRIMGTFKE